MSFADKFAPHPRSQTFVHAFSLTAHAAAAALALCSFLPALLRRHLLNADKDSSHSSSMGKGDKDGSTGKPGSSNGADGDDSATTPLLPITIPVDATGPTHPDDKQVIHEVQKLVKNAKHWKDNKGKLDKEMLKDNKEVKDSGKNYDPNLQIHNGKDKPEKPDMFKPEDKPKPDFDKPDKFDKEKDEKEEKEEKKAKICAMRKEKRKQELEKELQQVGKDGKGKQVYVGPDCYCEPQNPACGKVIGRESGIKRGSSGRLTGGVGAP